MPPPARVSVERLLLHEPRARHPRPPPGVPRPPRRRGGGGDAPRHRGHRRRRERCLRGRIGTRPRGGASAAARARAAEGSLQHHQRSGKEAPVTGREEGPSRRRRRRHAVPGVGPGPQHPLVLLPAAHVVQEAAGGGEGPRHRVGAAAGRGRRGVRPGGRAGRADPPRHAARRCGEGHRPCVDEVDERHPVPLPGHAGPPPGHGSGAAARRGGPRRHGRGQCRGPAPPGGAPRAARAHLRRPVLPARPRVRALRRNHRGHRGHLRRRCARPRVGAPEALEVREATAEG
mmetsp:Transcript_99415/g.281506  ORF Transcript_99415/g.281506 Transcript_99415/m.281506 type:complete len:288 (-) Transcript_99415:294-1157(-)